MSHRGIEALLFCCSAWLKWTNLLVSCGTFMKRCARKTAFRLDAKLHCMSFCFVLLSCKLLMSLVTIVLNVTSHNEKVLSRRFREICSVCYGHSRVSNCTVAVQRFSSMPTHGTASFFMSATIFPLLIYCPVLCCHMMLMPALLAALFFQAEVHW